MKAQFYRSRAYKVLALASNACRPGAWPFFADRIQRKLSGNRLSTFSQAQTKAVYGEASCQLPTALDALGLDPAVHDPRAIHTNLFEEGRRNVDNVDVPFRQLGIMGACDLPLVYSAAMSIGARDMLETGVALGWSSLALLTVAEAHDGQLVSVDLPYPFLIGQSWVGCAVPNHLQERWTLLRKADRLGIPSALRQSDGYDFVHYDSDKSEEGRSWAYPLLWEAVRPGGLMLSDDVGDNAAWADFCSDQELPLIVVRGERSLIGIARKPDGKTQGSAN
jgi:hypothetical protein